MSKHSHPKDNDSTSGSDQESTVRLDKWLWAARFYKTRSLAKTAIEGGKVRCDGQRPKVGRGLKIGTRIELSRGHEQMEVMVEALSEKRGPATEAQKLYQETERSQAHRAQQAANRKLMRNTQLAPDHRPDKKSRRQIHEFKRRNTE